MFYLRTVDGDERGAFSAGAVALKRALIGEGAYLRKNGILTTFLQFSVL